MVDHVTTRATAECAALRRGSLAWQNTLKPDLFSIQLQATSYNRVITMMELAGVLSCYGAATKLLSKQNYEEEYMIVAS